jgi:hypothetical protein
MRLSKEKPVDVTVAFEKPFIHAAASARRLRVSLELETV